MRVGFDLWSGKLVGLPHYGLLALLELKRGDSLRMEVVFSRDGAAATLEEDPVEFVFAAKLAAGDAEPLLLADEWSYDYDSGAWRGVLAANGVALAALVATAGYVDLVGELTFTGAGGGPQTSQTIIVRVHDDVWKGTEGTPLALPSPEDWLIARQAALTGAGAPGVGVTGAYIGQLYHDTSPGGSWWRWNGTAWEEDAGVTDLATTTEPGLMAAADKVKLDGVAAGAEVNVQSDWNAGSGDAHIQNKPTLGSAAAANILDSDTMTGALATNVPSAESVKAYVDANPGGTVDNAAVSAAIADVFEDDLEAAAGGVDFGDIYYLPDGSTRKRITPDEVVTYATANNISAEAAVELSVMLATYRAAGVEPTFLWVGGTRYNNTAQTAALIGGTGALVGTGDGITLGTNHVKFNGGKCLRFTNPATLKGSDVQTYFLHIVHAPPTTTKQMFGSYSTGARGVRVDHLADGEFTGYFSDLAASGTGSKTLTNGSYSQNSANGWQSFLLRNVTTGATTFTYEMRAINYGAMPGGGIWNDVDHIHIGSGHAATTATDGKIAVVMVADNCPATLTKTPEGMAIVNAPFSAGVVTDAEPLVVWQGDSHINFAFGFAAFVSGFDEGAGLASGGQWVGKHVTWNGGEGGVTATQITAMYGNYLRTGILAHRGENLWYFLHVEPEGDDIGAKCLALADKVSAETGATMVISTYGGYVSDPAPSSFSINVASHAAARGWDYVPFRDIKHAQISDGDWTDYGYFVDSNSTHATPAGRRIKAQVFAAAVPYPGDLGPRWDLSDLPAVTGIEKVGSTLTVDNGTCRNTPDSYTYQWLRNLAEISGATSATYELVGDDEDKYIACRVTAIKSGFNSAEITSDPTTMVGAVLYVVTDTDAIAYVSALESAGASVVSTQKEAIDNFHITGKSEGWYSLLRRLYLPIWEAAAPNAIDIIDLASGTFANSPTHAAGYVSANGTTQYFDTGDDPATIGLTNASGMMGVLFRNAISAITYHGGCAASTTERAVILNQTDANKWRMFYCNSAGGNLSSGIANAPGIMVGGKMGSGLARKIFHRSASEFSTITTSVGSGDEGTMPTGLNFYFMGANYSGVFQTPSSANEYGAFFLATGMDSTQVGNMTLALKTLWETCTGLTLP